MRTATGIFYGFGVLSESEGSRFSVIIQHTLRSLQGTESILRLNEAYLYNDSCIVSRGHGYETIILSFCLLFSAMTLHKTKTFLDILDNEPIKSFWFGQ